MVRGITFKLPNTYDIFIEKILSGIDMDKYVWKIDEDQVFISGGDFLFTSDIYAGQKFKRIISQSSYYVVFLNLQAFQDGNSLNEIKVYNDFLESNCELIVLVSDSIFVTIYSKNRKDIEAIKLNAQKNNFQEIEYITEENDRKTELVAM